MMVERRPSVIITGASRGVGAAVARCLGKKGAALALLARSADGLNDVAADIERLGGTAVSIVADVSDEASCHHAVEKTLERFGRLDALVNNAGIFEPLARISDADPAAWRHNVEVNLFGAFFLARRALPALRLSRGRIVNVSSGAAEVPIISGSAYCASKAALNHFTRVLAAEEASLTVLSVRPGVVDTGMQALIREEGPQSMPPEQLAYYTSLKTEGKLEPASVPGRSIAWLALHAPPDWSGEFLDYDDPRVIVPALSVFGKTRQT
jgi:NAD(P)-dependent dehydrogenase (short-subunit alcohol dehydrogenase family)